MIYVGIDIAKLNHFTAAISSDGETLIKPFKYTNDCDGFHLLQSKLATLDLSSIIIGLESKAGIHFQKEKGQVPRTWLGTVQAPIYNPFLILVRQHFPFRFLNQLLHRAAHQKIIADNGRILIYLAV